MRRMILAAILAGWASTLNARPVSLEGLRHCPLSAIHPADNDVHPDDDKRLKAQPAELPAPVARAILERVSKSAMSFFSKAEWAATKASCADTFSPVFRIDGPQGLQLYVAPRYFKIGNSVDYFFAYDPRTGTVTKSPPLIFTKWWAADDSLVKAPVVRIERGGKGNPPRLIVEERVHNGTVYNAVVYRYFEIGKDMSLVQTLAVETRAIFFDNHTDRRVTFLTPDRARIDVFSPTSEKDAPRGSLMLGRNGPGQPFRVLQRMPAPGTKPDALLTYCDSAKSDDQFLRTGCDYYY